MLQKQLLAHPAFSEWNVAGYARDPSLHRALHV